MKKSIIISLIIGIIISALAFYLAFRNVPIADLLVYIVSINYFWIFPAVLVVLTSFILRVFRWQIILESAGKVSFWQAFHPLMIGFMINCILPGRVGEVARPAVLNKKENIPFSTGLATVAAERVFDVSILIIFFAALLATVHIDPNLDIVFGKYHLNRETLVTLVNFVENFASGFALVRHPSKVCICIGLSFLIWGLAGFSYYLMAQGCPGIELSFTEIFAVMIIICFFIALPSVPGFWGIWEAGGVFALVLFGVSSKDAAGYTLVNHAIQMFPVIIVGLVSAMVTSINILQVSYEKRDK